jgi:hypothetical protein
MKTAMQELVEQLEFIKLNKTKNLHEVIFFDGVLAIIDAGKYLEKEKEQIIDAYDKGYKACDLDEALEINKTMFSGEKYYEQTYNQNK